MAIGFGEDAEAYLRRTNPQGEKEGPNAYAARLDQLMDKARREGILMNPKPEGYFTNSLKESTTSSRRPVQEGRAPRTEGVSGANTTPESSSHASSESQGGSAAGPEGSPQKG